MNPLAILITINIIAASTIPNLAYAQTPAPSTTAPMTGMKPDRTITDEESRQVMRAKQATLKYKRAECSKRAKKQKLSLLKRQSFIHDCMSQRLTRP
jgi:hypothetical protein